MRPDPTTYLRGSFPTTAGRAHRLGTHRAALALVLTHAVLIWPAAGCARSAATGAAPPAAVPATGQTTPTSTSAPTQTSAPQEPQTTRTASSASTDRAAGSAQVARPRVRLVATGGTISNRPGSRLTADELIASVPELAADTQPEAEQFANVSSGEMTLDQWLGLARRLNAIVRDDPSLAGLVVTSGTDTLEELAYFLHLTVRTDRPIVVVGAMRRPGLPGYEGQANLLAGFRVAADPHARGKGALVVLNDEILSAREATKTDAQRLQTFQTRGYGVLGVVDADRVVWYRDVIKRHSAKSEFDVDTIKALPRVDVLMTYQEASGDLVRAAADLGARGIVLATAAGGTSGTQSEGVRYALDKQVVVVRTTRTGAGRVMSFGPAPRPPAQTSGATATSRAGGADPAQPAQARAATVSGEDLAPIKARVLLMLALSRTQDPTEIQRMFLEY